MEKYYYGYDEFRDDLEKLIQKIDWEFDTIMPIARGGLSMGQLLGEYYDIREVYAINTIGYDDTTKLESVKVFNIPDLKNSQNILILDDIVDSGDTIEVVLVKLKSLYPDKSFKVASIFYKPSASLQPDFCVRQAKEWINFFWTVDLKKEK
ncbi:MAG: phosphoribosyltransferase family protein [Campylobacterota bacterium]|nr:phosphoribosyltransferase family protein [Campylobacterota bacterium]